MMISGIAFCELSIRNAINLLSGKIHFVPSSRILRCLLVPLTSLLIRYDKHIELTNITDEVVKLEMLDMGRRLDHIKTLMTSLKSSLVLERIVCSNCLTLINPLCEFVPVNIRNMDLGSKSYTVMEPQCPVCGAFIQGEQFLHIAN
jgi:hypothetical protein